MPTRDGEPVEHERLGSARGMAAFAWMLRWMPRFLVYWIAMLPVVYYYIRRPEARRSTPSYQRRLGLRHGPVRRFWFGLTQAAAFSRIILDNMYLGVTGPSRFSLNFMGTQLFKDALARKKGLILLSAHVGNWHLAVNFLGRTGAKAHMVTEDVRAPEVRRHMDAAKKRAILLEVHDAGEGPALALKLQGALARGEVVVLSGDRAYGGREIEAELLGAPVLLPQLGFRLSLASEAPLCVALAFSTGMQRYDFVGVGPINDDLPAGLSDDDAVSLLAQRFADCLGGYVRRFPRQWFNFLDFWRDCDAPRPE